MGVFSWPMTVSHTSGAHVHELQATVDTGAAYSLLPSALLESMEVEPLWTQAFDVADGSSVSLPLGQMQVTVNGRTATCPVVFGPDNSVPLMGAVTLEILAMGVDPLRQEVAPTRAKLY